MYIDDVSIPDSFWTIEEGHNDKIYMRLSDGSGITDNIIIITPGSYHSIAFATELSNRINHHFSNPAHSCIYSGSTSVVISFP